MVELRTSMLTFPKTKKLNPKLTTKSSLQNLTSAGEEMSARGHFVGRMAPKSHSWFQKGVFRKVSVWRLQIMEHNPSLGHMLFILGLKKEVQGWSPGNTSYQDLTEVNPTTPGSSGTGKPYFKNLINFPSLNHH